MCSISCKPVDPTFEKIQPQIQIAKATKRQNIAIVFCCNAWSGPFVTTVNKKMAELQNKIEQPILRSTPSELFERMQINELHVAALAAPNEILFPLAPELVSTSSLLFERVDQQPMPAELFERVAAMAAHPNAIIFPPAPELISTPSVLFERMRFLFVIVIYFDTFNMFAHACAMGHACPL